MCVAVVLGLALGAAGCKSVDGPSSFQVPGGSYASAFEETKSMLREMRFELDRVDARAGVITTEPKATSGLATPWDVEQSSLTQEWGDLLNRHFRIVRIEFGPWYGTEDEPAAVTAPGPVDLGSPTAPLPDPADLRGFEGPMVATVRVVVERLHRPGWRPQTSAIGLSSFTTDTVKGSPWIMSPVSRDTKLEARLGARASRRIDRASRERAGDAQGGAVGP